MREIPLATIPTYQQKQRKQSAYNTHTTKPQLTAYYPAACFIPAKKMRPRAIKKRSARHMDMTHFCNGERIIQQTHDRSHGTRESKRTRSSVHPKHTIIGKKKYRPPAPIQSRATFLTVVNFDDLKEKNYTNLCGRLSFQSRRGNRYIFILYYYDRNAVLAEAMNNRLYVENGQIIQRSGRKTYGNIIQAKVSHLI